MRLGHRVKRSLHCKVGDLQLGHSRRILIRRASCIFLGKCHTTISTMRINYTCGPTVCVVHDTYNFMCIRLFGVRRHLHNRARWREQPENGQRKRSGRNVERYRFDCRPGCACAQLDSRGNYCVKWRIKCRSMWLG